MRRLPALRKAVVRAATRFARDEGGTVLLIFALAATAVIMFVGVAMDYARSSRARASLQNAADAVVLSVAREAQDAASNEALKEMAGVQMATMLSSQYQFEVTSVATTSGTLTLTAEGSVPAGLTSVAGYETLRQRVTSEAAWGTGKLEVALVLDSTGSMGQYNRMVELKKAAKAMLDELKASEDGLVKIAIVPFDVNVRVANSYKTASWFKTDWWVSLFWNGCLADRDQSKDVSDAAVTTSAATKYPGALCSSNNLKTIQPLTDDFTLLNNKVDSLTPAGNTNITIGLAWGMTLLSSQAPFTEGVAPGTKDVTKIIVLMTDGDNTANRWTSTASSIDARTSLACQSAKDSKIVLYTIRLMEGNGSLLSNCATSNEHYYDVENVADLVPAFQAIGEQLSQLRISQ
jgi:Flp pilus assembly protein TadG